MWFDSMDVLAFMTVFLVVGFGVFCLITLFVSLTHGWLSDEAQPEQQRSKQERKDFT